MNVLRAASAAALLVATAAAGSASAGESARPRLHFDPFARPVLEASTGGNSDAPRAEEWAPVLNATLVAGERSLANLGGIVLGIGEESHGYRLLEVDAWQAVFEHGGERTVLPVTSREGGR